MELFSLIFLSIVGLLLIILNIIFFRKTVRLEKTINGGASNNSKNLLSNSPADFPNKLDKDVQDLYEINSKLSKIAKRGICKVGVTRFNALGEKSGNQSFAIALLNYQDSGIIFSNIQTVEGSRLFIRHIHHGDETNGVKLLDEEIKALEKAKQVVF
ncbi:MAG: DUF4446 family protein [Candidatus Moraniibacteriota bacterium]